MLVLPGIFQHGEVVDKKDYMIQALTQQRDAAQNEIARIIAEANEQIDKLKSRITELEESKNGLER